MPDLARRYLCEHSRNPNHTSLGSCGQCSAGSGKPSRRNCRCCGGQLLIERGLWTVRQWDESKRGQGYAAMEIVREFKSERHCRAFMERNGSEDWVWHWVRHGGTEVHQP